MKDVNRYLICSIGEYVDCVKAIRLKLRNNSHLWFRGHSKASYTLLPGIFREPFILHDENENPLIEDRSFVFLNHGAYKGYSTKRLMEAFKKYTNIKRIFSEPKDDFEWLCLMQHYGIPTRLLDWSTNAFTALYFAVRKQFKLINASKKKCRRDLPDRCSEDEFNGAVVYIIDPCEINGLTIYTSSKKPFKSILYLSKRKDLISHVIFPNDFDKTIAMFPICVASNKFDFRILAQQGVFMLFGKMPWHLEYIENIRPLIHKIFIPFSAVHSIAMDLNGLGFNDKIFFPDRDPISIIAKNRLEKKAKKILANEDAFVLSIINKKKP